jgi:hypothetical protein
VKLGQMKLRPKLCRRRRGWAQGEKEIEIEVAARYNR